MSVQLFSHLFLFVFVVIFLLWHFFVFVIFCCNFFCYTYILFKLYAFLSLCVFFDCCHIKLIVCCQQIFYSCAPSLLNEQLVIFMRVMVTYWKSSSQSIMKAAIVEGLTNNGGRYKKARIISSCMKCRRKIKKTNNNEEDEGKNFTTKADNWKENNMMLSESTQSSWYVCVGPEIRCSCYSCCRFWFLNERAWLWRKRRKWNDCLKIKRA